MVLGAFHYYSMPYVSTSITNCNTCDTGRSLLQDPEDFNASGWPILDKSILKKLASGILVDPPPQRFAALVSGFLTSPQTCQKCPCLAFLETKGSKKKHIQNPISTHFKTPICTWREGGLQTHLGCRVATIRLLFKFTPPLHSCIHTSSMTGTSFFLNASLVDEKVHQSQSK